MPPSKKLKILFVTSEVIPFVKTGGLADVSSALPQKLMEMGHQIRIVCPKYGAIDERKYKIHEVVRLKDLTTNIGDKEVTYSLRSSFLISQKNRVQIYFLDNKEYFASRHSLYADPLTREEFEDNDERYALFAKAVFELILKLGWIPDIIHCNDWQSGLVPLYKNVLFGNEKAFEKIKTIFTVHNMAFQGEFPKKRFPILSLPDELNSEKGIIHKGKINFLKAGIKYADIVNTVSEGYAKQICEDKNISNGLNKDIVERKNKIVGIINGIDTTIWNPEKDKHIERKYNLKTIRDKKENKYALLDKFGFEGKPDLPVIGLISKLYDVKGLNLVQKAFEDLMKLDVRFVLLGTGDKQYHRFFEEMFMKYSDKFSCYLGFDDELAHMIEAGADMLLMPSKYEPCGLNQMYSLNYGTVPIVHETGGLADTVKNYDEAKVTGNGFVFSKFNAKELVKTIKYAIKIYDKKSEDWLKLMSNGMKMNFSWEKSAKKYLNLYKRATK